MDPIISIGKNKKHNFELIDAATATDIWFHLENGPSAHVILKTGLPVNEIPRKVIKRCARLCIENSGVDKGTQRAHLQNVIYTEIANVQKTEILGQVTLSKPCKKIQIRI